MMDIRRFIYPEDAPEVAPSTIAKAITVTRVAALHIAEGRRWTSLWII
jgi:hypothetical protein